MSAITFDVHKFIWRLREAGFEENQAETVSDSMGAQSATWLTLSHGVDGLAQTSGDTV